MKSIPILNYFSVLSFVVFGFIYWMIPQTTIAFFDQEAVQGQFIRQLAEIKATEVQVAQATKRFNEVLNQVLIDCAAKKKTVILKKREVLAGGMDITDEVRMQLSRAMRAQS